MAKRNVGLFKLRLADLQVLGHSVEGIDQRPDLIRGIGYDPDVQITLRDRLGGIRQHLNRHRNPAGHIEPEPCGAEQDQDRDHSHEQVGSRLNRIFHGLDLPILGVLLGDPLHLGEQRLGHIRVHHDDPIHFAGVHIRRDRDARTDKPSPPRFLHQGDFLLVVQDLEHELSDRQIQHRRRDGGVHRFGQRFQLVGIHLDAGQVMVRPSSRDGGLEQVTLLGDQQLFPKELKANGPRAVHRQDNMPFMVHPRHFLGVLEHLLDLIVEPHIHGLVDQAASHKSQEHGRDQRETNERGNQLDPETRPHQAMPTFEIGLDQIPGEQQGEDDEADQIQVDEQEDEGIASTRQERI